MDGASESLPATPASAAGAPPAKRVRRERPDLETRIEPAKTTMREVAHMQYGGKPMPKSEEEHVSYIPRDAQVLFAADDDGNDDSRAAPAPRQFAPQVKFVNGRIVLDEESLTVTADEGRVVDHDNCELVVEHARGRIRTSYNTRTKSERWKPADTLEFYRALRMCGTDFSLMEKLLPGRTRKQIKAKFKKEEKDHPALIERSLTSRLEIDLEEMRKAGLAKIKDPATGDVPPEARTLEEMLDEVLGGADDGAAKEAEGTEHAADDKAAEAEAGEADEEPAENPAAKSKRGRKKKTLEEAPLSPGQAQQPQQAQQQKPKEEDYPPPRLEDLDIPVPTLPADPEAAYQSLLDLRNCAKTVYKKINRVREALKEWVDESVGLGDELIHLTEAAGFDKTSCLGKHFTYFSTSFKAASSQYSPIIDGLRNYADGPLQVFLEYDYQELFELRKRKERLAAECEAMHARMLSKKPEGQPTAAEIEKLDQSLAAVEKQFAEKLMMMNQRKITRFAAVIADITKLYIYTSSKADKLWEILRKKMYQFDIITLHTEWDRPQKEGFLQKRTQMGFHKVFLSLRDGVLHQYREGRDYNPDSSIDLVTATVRLVPPDEGEMYSYRFEVCSPRLQKPLVLQAESEQQRSEWVKAIQGAIGDSLSSLKVRSEDASQADPVPPSQQSGIALSDKMQDWLRSIPGNKFCADCEAPDPTWASINLGVLVCLECSGVHRSLGTHITKVRSLALDRWNLETLMFMKNRGNTKSNAVYEALLGPETHRPPPNAERSFRDNFIRDKYQRKAFVVKPTVSKEELCKSLHAAAQRRDTGAADEILKLLAQGAEVNSPSADAEHRAVVFEPLVRGNLLALEALIQNGANTSAVDSRGWTPLHYAAFFNRPRCLIRLLDVAKPRADNSGLFPADIAAWNSAVECAGVLKGTIPPNVELTLEAVMDSGTNAHEDVFAIPRSIMLPPVAPPDTVQRGSAPAGGTSSGGGSSGSVSSGSGSVTAGVQRTWSNPRGPGTPGGLTQSLGAPAVSSPGGIRMGSASQQQQQQQQQQQARHGTMLSTLSRQRSPRYSVMAGRSPLSSSAPGEDVPAVAMAPSSSHQLPPTRAPPMPPTGRAPSESVSQSWSGSSDPSAAHRELADQLTQLRSGGGDAPRQRQ
eukprot:m51a1_g6372 hypothetical protein (1150) ;mRNA; r:126741-131727